MSDKEIFLAQLEDIVEPIVDELSLIFKEVKKSSGSDDVIKSIKSVTSELSKLKKEMKVTVNAPDIDLSPIIEKFSKVGISDKKADALINIMDKYSANVLTLNENVLSLIETIPSLQSSVDELNNTLNKDTKISIQRRGQLIESLEVKKKK